MRNHNNSKDVNNNNNNTTTTTNNNNNNNNNTNISYNVISYTDIKHKSIDETSNRKAARSGLQQPTIPSQGAPNWLTVQYQKV